MGKGQPSLWFTRRKARSWRSKLCHQGPTQAVRVYLRRILLDGLDANGFMAIGYAAALVTFGVSRLIGVAVH